MCDHKQTKADIVSGECYKCCMEEMKKQAIECEKAEKYFGESIPGI